MDGGRRDERRKQGGGCRAGAAARNQVADGNLVSADASRKRRSDARMVEIELRIAGGGFRIGEWGLGGALFCGALVRDLDAAVPRLFERVGAEEFLFG